MDIAQDLLNKLPIDSIAKELGVSREEVEDAIAVGAPTLLGGLRSEASASPQSAEALLRAIAKDHDGKVLDSDNPLDHVDRNDGEKIVRHVFGDKTDAVVNRLGGTDTNQAGSSLFSKILPMIAPLVMSWISRKMGGAVQGTDDEPGGLGGVLGDLLGGGDKGSAGGIGDVVGDILGRGAEGNAGGFDMGGLTDILGGLAGKSGSAGRDIPDISDILGQLGK